MQGFDFRIDREPTPLVGAILDAIPFISKML